MAMDVAGAEYDVFKSLRRFVQEFKEANPLEPRLRGMEDFGETLAERMPKEQEE